MSDDGIKIKMRTYPENGIWSYCEGCERQWPHAYDTLSVIWRVLHTTPNGEHVECTKRRVD